MMRGCCKGVEASQPEDVVVASTGVIGQVLPIEPILEAAPKLAEMLSEDGSAAAAKAIMTTDGGQRGGGRGCHPW